GAGASEDKIGRALVNRRDRVVLCSKSANRTADGIRRDLETSLELLQTDHIEFYYFHGVNTLEEMDTITGPGGALEGLQRAKDEGLIAGMGLSSHRPPMYIEALNRLPLSLILIWSNFLEDLYLPEISREIIPLAKEKGVGVTAMKPLADGYLYRSASHAMRYALGGGAEVIVCGMNTVNHVYQAASAVCQGPADDEERAMILRDAPELGCYVCRQCGACSDDLMEIFRLEGYCDRQMIDFLEHDPADYALRVRLSGWFSLTDTAREHFAQKGWNEDAMLAEAARIQCPYYIDVQRKTRLALAKLKKESPQRI
ncbi:aldo/keto reductase, partial [bacterium]|nr:aldo/keto reductase [bacterium]